MNNKQCCSVVEVKSREQTEQWEIERCPTVQLCKANVRKISRWDRSHGERNSYQTVLQIIIIGKWNCLAKMSSIQAIPYSLQASRIRFFFTIQLYAESKKSAPF